MIKKRKKGLYKIINKDLTNKILLHAEGFIYINNNIYITRNTNVDNKFKYGYSVFIDNKNMFNIFFEDDYTFVYNKKEIVFFINDKKIFKILLNNNNNITDKKICKYKEIYMSSKYTVVYYTDFYYF